MANPTTIAPADMTQSARIKTVVSVNVTKSSGAVAVPFFIAPCNITIVWARAFVTTTFDTAAATITIGTSTAVSAFGTATTSDTQAAGTYVDFTLSQVDVSDGTVFVVDQTSTSGAGVYRVQIDWIPRGSL